MRSRYVSSLAEVGEVEVLDKEQRLTAFPRSGQPVLPAISTLIQREQWELKEIHLEAGRLDEVFRAITTTSAHEEVAHG